MSLVGFGVDSAIEVSAALILTWRLRQDRSDDCTQDVDSRATKAIAVSFAVLAAFVTFEAVRDLVAGAEPAVSVPGVVLAALSLAVMPFLARAKARLAPVLGSTAAAADGAQTNLWPCCPPSSSSASAPTGCSAGGGRTRSPGSGSVSLPPSRHGGRGTPSSLEDTCCA